MKTETQEKSTETPLPAAPWSSRRNVGDWKGRPWDGNAVWADGHCIARCSKPEVADLLAAAPELLEALVGLLANAPQPKGIRHDYSYLLYRESAKRAIAKATEGSQ